MADEEGRVLKDHIVRLYCERYTCRQIADLTGQAYQYVRDSLMERGITPHNRARRRSRVKTVDRRMKPSGSAYWTKDQCPERPKTV